MDCHRCRPRHISDSMAQVAPGVWQCSVCGRVYDRQAYRARLRAAAPRPEPAPAPAPCPTCGVEPAYLFDHPGGPFCACTRPRLTTQEPAGLPE